MRVSVDFDGEGKKGSVSWELGRKGGRGQHLNEGGVLGQVVVQSRVVLLQRHHDLFHKTCWISTAQSSVRALGADVHEQEGMSV
eukprot:1068310-Rhodomonas_salina.7